MFICTRFMTAILLFFCSSLAMGSQDVARARLRKIVGHMQPVAQEIAPAPVAATANFVKNPELAKIVRQNWGDHLVAYEQTIIRTIFENEERYKKEFFCLLHAHKSENRLLSQLLRNAHEWATGDPLRSDFEYLRFWEEGSDFKDVNAYLNTIEIDKYTKAQWMNENGSRINFSDLRPSVAAVLLAVNPCLFSNPTSSSECSFEHFVKGSAGGHYSSHIAMISKLFDRYGWDKKYIPELLAIDKEFSTLTGDLIQLFIPKELISKFAYLSESAGIVIERPVEETLELLQNNIGAVKDARDMQVRLFFAKSGPLL